MRIEQEWPCMFWFLSSGWNRVATQSVRTETDRREEEEKVGGGKKAEP